MNDELLFRFATARATPDEEAAVSEWVASAPANERLLRDTIETLHLAADADDELGFGPPPSAEEILARGRGGGVWRRPDHRGRRGRVWIVPLTAAATLAVLVPLAIHESGFRSNAEAPLTPFASDEFVTEAEPATVGLTDGSVVRLAPTSRLRVHNRPDSRDVSLSGRGYFAVAADADKPFTVHSDAGTVTVLGTRFDMSVTGEDLRVIVVEGSVRLTARGSQVIVEAGQLAQVLGGNLVPPVDVPDPASLIGWIGNFIAFRDTPLRTVAREIELRFDVRVVLSDEALGDRTVTSLFAGRTYEEIAEVICVVVHLECTRVGDVLRMAPAR